MGGITVNDIQEYIEMTGDDSMRLIKNAVITESEVRFYDKDHAVVNLQIHINGEDNIWNMQNKIHEVHSKVINISINKTK